MNYPLATLEAPSSKATMAQLGFVRDLLSQTFPTAKPAELAKLQDVFARAARHEVSTFIDVVKRQQAEAQRAERAAAAVEPVDTTKPMRDLFGDAPILTDFKAGLYHGKNWSDGKVLFVYAAKTGTHFLAKEVVGYGTADVRFEYVGSAKSNTDPDQRLTADEHAAFGQLAGACGFCGLTLNDPHSRQLGYGPICAGHNGLPY